MSRTSNFISPTTGGRLWQEKPYNSAPLRLNRHGGRLECVTVSRTTFSRLVRGSKIPTLLMQLTIQLERIALLIHMLCDLRTSHGITAQKLKHAGQFFRRSISPIERLQLLDELYGVREREEKHIDGATGMSALADTVCANEDEDESTKIYISRMNQPESMAATGSKSSQRSETPHIARVRGHEPHVDHAPIPFRPNQAVITLTEHVDSWDLMDISHQQGFLCNTTTLPRR